MKVRTAILLTAIALVLGFIAGERIGYFYGFENGGVDGFADGVRYADDTAREGECDARTLKKWGRL